MKRGVLETRQVNYYAGDALKQAQEIMADVESQYETIRFNVADGYAIYAVDGDTLLFVDIFGDGYDVHPALIRGLTEEEVRELVERENRFKAMLP